MAAHWWPQPAGLTLAAEITWCQWQWYRGSIIRLAPNLKNYGCPRWRLIEKVHCVECLGMGCPTEVQPGKTLRMIARYCKPPEIFALWVLQYCLKLFQKLGPTICCMPITCLGDCRIRRSYLAKLFLHQSSTVMAQLVLGSSPAIPPHCIQWVIAPEQNHPWQESTRKMLSNTVWHSIHQKATWQLWLSMALWGSNWIAAAKSSAWPELPSPCCPKFFVVTLSGLNILGSKVLIPRNHSTRHPYSRILHYHLGPMPMLPIIMNAVQLKSLQTWVVWLQLLNWHGKLSWKHTGVCWQLSWRQQSCLLPALTWRKYSIYANVLRTEFSCAYHGLLASPTQQLSVDNYLYFVCGRRKAQHDTHSLPTRHKAFWTRLLTIRMQLQMGSNKNGRPSNYMHIQQPSCRLVPTVGIHQSMARVPRSIDRQAT